MNIILTRKHLKVHEDDVCILNKYKENLLNFYTNEIKNITNKDILFAIDKAKLSSMNGMINLIKTSPIETILKIKLSLELIKNTSFLSGTAINSLFGSKRYKTIKNTNIIDGEKITCLFGYIQEDIKGYSVNEKVSRHTKNNKKDVLKMNIETAHKLKDHSYYFNWFKTKLVSKGKASRGYCSNIGAWLVQEEKKHRFYDFLSNTSKIERSRYTAGLYEYDIKTSVLQYILYKISKVSKDSRIKLLTYIGEKEINLDYFNNIRYLISKEFPKLDSKKVIISFINQFFKHKKDYYINKDISYAFIYNNPIFNELKSVLSLIEYSNESYNRWETETIYKFVKHYDIQNMLILHDAIYTKKDISLEDLSKFDVIFKKSEKIEDISLYTKKEKLLYERFLKHKVLKRKNLKFETRLKVSLEYEMLNHKYEKDYK